MALPTSSSFPHYWWLLIRILCGFVFYESNIPSNITNSHLYNTVAMISKQGLFCRPFLFTFMKISKYQGMYRILWYYLKALQPRPGKQADSKTMCMKGSKDLWESSDGRNNLMEGKSETLTDLPGMTSKSVKWRGRTAAVNNADMVV